MPRYFFDFCQGQDRCADGEGAEFADVEQAYLEAFSGAQDMWSELLRQRRDPRHCMFEVRNQERKLLFVLPFQEVVDSCHDRKHPAVQQSQDVEQAAMTLNDTKRICMEFRETLNEVRKTLAESHALLQAKV